MFLSREVDIKGVSGLEGVKGRGRMCHGGGEGVFPEKKLSRGEGVSELEGVKGRGRGCLD